MKGATKTKQESTGRSVARLRAVKESPARTRALKVAAHLFADRGFSGVGVHEIGLATGLGRGALYYHISSKEDLLCDIMTAYMSDLVASGRAILRDEPDPVLRIRALSRYLMRTIADHLPELTVCFREVHALTAKRKRRVLQLHSDYEAVWAETLRDGVAAGVYKPVSVVVLKGLLGMYFHSFLWLDPRGSQGPEEIGDAFSEIVLRSVARYDR